MDRLTEYHCGISVIRNKELLSEAMKKLAIYEDLEEHDAVLIRAFQIQEYSSCPKCNHCEKKIEEVWIHPRLLKTDGFYFTLEEAEEALKNYKKGNR